MCKIFEENEKSVEVDLTEIQSNNLILQACCCISPFICLCVWPFLCTCQFIEYQTNINVWPFLSQINTHCFCGLCFFSVNLNSFYSLFMFFFLSFFTNFISHTDTSLLPNIITFIFLPLSFKCVIYITFSSIISFIL